jgi:hypothetical protein
MTIETDLKQRLATLQATLAEAMKACPECEGTCISLGAVCDLGCQGTGEVAMFPEFRQVCKCRHLMRSCLCPDKQGWQVCAGDLADGLAGLTYGQADRVFKNLRAYYWNWEPAFEGKKAPMPSALEIRVKELELICDVAGLEVTDV